tara:strand:- start:5427 stop:6800 length:1374 start_codon:yes stop_codon:yes gene_type:complete
MLSSTMADSPSLTPEQHEALARILTLTLENPSHAEAAGKRLGDEIQSWIASANEEKRATLGRQLDHIEAAKVIALGRPRSGPPLDTDQGVVHTLRLYDRIYHDLAGRPALEAFIQVQVLRSSRSAWRTGWGPVDPEYFRRELIEQYDLAQCRNLAAQPAWAVSSLLFSDAKKGATAEDPRDWWRLAIILQIAFALHVPCKVLGLPFEIPSGGGESGGQPFACRDLIGQYLGKVMELQSGEKESAVGKLLRSVAAQLGPAARLVPADPDPAPLTHDYMFHRVGKCWHLRFLEQETTLGDSMGLAYIHAILLAHPNSVHVKELESGVNGGHPPGASVFAAQPEARIADPEAIEAARSQLKDLTAERLACAPHEGHDLDERIGVLNSYLDSCQGRDKGGREFAGESELARWRVGKTITRTLQMLDRELPTLGQHLKREIQGRTSMTPIYAPPEPAPSWFL